MNGKFSVQFRKSNGNLHLRPRGELDGSSAWVMINIIRERYDGKGRVFIDTQDLGEIHAFGCGIFKSELRKGIVPPDCLFFKGEKAFELAPNGSKVILVSKRQACPCNGTCINCSRFGKRDKPCTL
jgi:hypothetical protein